MLTGNYARQPKIQHRQKILYATIPTGQKSKGRAAIAVRKDIPHSRLNIKTTIQAVALEIQPMGKSKITLCSIYLPPRHNKRGRHEGASKSASNTNNFAGRLEHTIQYGAVRKEAHEEK